MWTEIRQEIERAREALQLPPEQFRPLGLTEWPAVEKRLYQEFTEQSGELVKWTWPWARTTSDRPLASMWLETGWPHELLLKLVAPDELCFACFDGESKGWWYQGTVAAIVAVSAEIQLFEIGVLSKHYDWLLYLSHHDVLYAIGEPMTTRLRQLAGPLGQPHQLRQRPAMARPAR